MEVKLWSLVWLMLLYRSSGEVVRRRGRYVPGKVGIPIPQCPGRELDPMFSRTMLRRPRDSEFDFHEDLRFLQALGARP